jgi:hypothetical protein
MGMGIGHGHAFRNLWCEMLKGFNTSTSILAPVLSSLIKIKYKIAKAKQLNFS